jgi:hypothetical protein
VKRNFSGEANSEVPVPLGEKGSVGRCDDEGEKEREI